MNSLVLEGHKRGITVNSIASMAMTRMSLDDKTGPLLKPEFVTSIVALLASEDHKGSDDISLQVRVTTPK